MVDVQRCTTVENRKTYNHEEVSALAGCSVANLYLLPLSMVQSPSWEANWFAASQEIPRIFKEPDG